MDQRKQLKKIVKNSIEIGDNVRKSFDKDKSVDKAKAAVYAYKIALTGIILLNKEI
jgi:hypothetical protein